MSTPSIRRALLIRCGIGVGSLLFLLSAITYILVRENLYRELDDDIKQAASLLSNQVELEDGHIIYEWQEGLGTNQNLSTDNYFQFWDEKSGTTMRSPSLRFHDLPRFTGIDGGLLFRSIILPNGHRARALGVRIYPFVLPAQKARMIAEGQVIDPKTLPFTLVVAGDGEPTYQTLDHLKNILIVGTLLILALGFIIIQRVVIISLRPINLLGIEVQERSEHQLDTTLKLPEEFPIELIALAKNFDLLLSRVAATRQREKDFIRHAAHELRTPIAGLRATTDLALSQPRTAEAYAEHLATCQKTAIELGELVKRLSLLARLEQSASAAVFEAINIQESLSDCLESFKPLFENAGLTINYETASGSVIAKADKMLLQIIINNLLDNALSYSLPGGEVRIRTICREGHPFIHILNPVDEMPENLDRLFEPLFRREASRHDSTSHLGIGLTLSQNAAHAMEGSLIVRKAADREIEFILKLQPVPQNS